MTQELISIHLTTTLDRQSVVLILGQQGVSQQKYFPMSQLDEAIRVAQSFHKEHGGVLVIDHDLICPPSTVPCPS